MKKLTLVLLIVSTLMISLSAEITVSSDSTVFYSFGLADDTQMLPETFLGGYFEKKNGSFIGSTIRLGGGFENRYDYGLDLSMTQRTGSSYLNMQLAPTSPDFSINLARVNTRLYLSKLFFPNLKIAGAETRIDLNVGKFRTAAVDASISRFNLESSLGMLALANSPSISVETSIRFPGITQLVFGTRSSLTLDFTTSGLITEAVPRLYDTDGGVSQHGRVVVGEYAPQFLVRLALNNYVLPFGTLTASANYAYNASGIYSGHSAGGSASLSTVLVPNAWQLPIGASFVFHEKNIDLLAGTTGYSSDANSASFRNTMQAGFAIGMRHLASSFGFISEPRTDFEATISGRFSNIKHIYRDPLNIFAVGIDTQLSILPTLFVGGGFMAGTLGTVTWQTREDVSSAFDNFSREYGFVDNLGYEIYLGIKVLSSLEISLGYSHLRGMAMNHGLQSMQSGMAKFRQPDTSLTDQRLETKGIFMLAKISL